MSANVTPDEADSAGNTPLDKLCRQLLVRWQKFPPASLQALRELLASALQSAEQADAEIITVMNPSSRPMRLQLHALVDSTDLDSFYHQEWAELAVSHRGVCYLVYRRKDGGDYAVEWSTATSVPTEMLTSLSPELAMAMFESDED